MSYESTLTGLPVDKPVRVWVPVPSSDDDQEVEIVKTTVPAGATINRDPEYGNQLLYFETKPAADGTLGLALEYKVLRYEVKGSQQREGKGQDTARFLQPDKLVPITGKPLDLIKDKTLPADQAETAKVLYDVVNGHMRYSKEGTGWGTGDSVWACESKFGNCSDFHSLFISLARSRKIPAKFEIGFPLPAKPTGDIPGYHCWAKFKPDHQGWIPVDISEANKHPEMAGYYFGNLTPDRIAFSTGRDLTLVPKQDGPPVNFLVYPYAEVDGKPLPKKQFTNHVSFKNVETK